MLKAKNLAKIYSSGNQLAIGIHNINCEFELDEFVLVVGESGSGKTTLLNVLSGIDSYEEGELFINGETTANYTEHDFDLFRRKYVGFVFQNYALVDSLTVYENVLLALKVKNYPRKIAKQKALDMIKKVGLENRAFSKAVKLSGGEKQRCVIARALCSDARIIACDEPTGNLDSETSKEIVKLLANVAKNRLVIVVTHDPNQFLEHATRLIRIFDGEIIEDKVLASKPKAVSVEPPYFAKPKWYDGIFLALKNIIATPKKALLVTIILLLFILVSIYSVESSLSYNLEKKVRISNYDLFDFTLGKENSLLILPKRGDTFTESDVAYLGKYNETIINPFYYLTTFTGGVDVGYRTLYGTFNTANRDGFVIRKNHTEMMYGRAPVSDNEVAIGLRLGYYSISSNDYLTHFDNYMVAVRDSYVSKAITDYVLVGLYFIEADADRAFHNEFAFSDAGMERLHANILNSPYFFHLKAMNHEIDFYRYYKELELADITLLFNYDHVLSYYDLTFLGKSIDYGEFNKEVRYGTLGGGAGPPPDVFSMNYQAGVYLSNKNPLFIFQEFQSSTELEYYLKQYNETGNYYAFKPHDLAYIPRELDLPTLTLYVLIYASGVAILLVGYFVTYFTIKGISNSKRKDINIYRALGYTPSYLQYIATNELLILAFIALILGYFGIYVMKIVSDTNYQMLSMLNVFTDSPFRKVALIILMLLLVIRISYKANRKTLSYSIQEVLKGGRNND